MFNLHMYKPVLCLVHMESQVPLLLANPNVETTNVPTLETMRLTGLRILKPEHEILHIVNPIYFVRTIDMSTVEILVTVGIESFTVLEACKSMDVRLSVRVRQWTF